jgi:hypothetical protein
MRKPVTGWFDSAVYELRTSGGFSGPIRHFRPLRILQLIDSTLLNLIVVRIHAGEPNFKILP